MDISELQVIYSPHYKGTNNLIKRQFRLNRMVCHAIKLTFAGYLRTEMLISTIVGIVGLLILSLAKYDST